MTFSGVDGAGKTTILRAFSTKLTEEYGQQLVELRHRPSMLPILSALKHGKKEAESKTMEVLPRTGGNKSKFSSYLRFFYYLLDYVVGQWLVYFRYTRKGKIVVYDRYYFDFINDSRRTNIDLNSRFTRFFYKLIFKPELNFFLYAPADIILQRKQEMDRESIISLTEKYQSLFSDLDRKVNGRYFSIENIDLEETLALVDRYYAEGVDKC